MKSEGEELKIRNLSSPVRILTDTQRCWLTCEDHWKSPTLSHALGCLAIQKVPGPACGCSALAI